MYLSLVIPAYNEADGVTQVRDALVPVLQELREQHNVEVVFVDDGSTDDTLSLLREAFYDIEDINIVVHEVNRNLGAALRTGFQHVNGDVIVTTDFDGTYSFDLIPGLVTRFIELETDILTASPYNPQGAVEGVPAWRLLFSRGASLLYRLLVRWNIYTWTALFRAYKREVVDSVTFDSDDFLAGTELLVNAIRKGYKVSEYPVTLRTRTFGHTSIKVARVTMKHLGFQLNVLLLRLSGQFKQNGRARGDRVEGAFNDG